MGQLRPHRNFHLCFDRQQMLATPMCKCVQAGDAQAAGHAEAEEAAITLVERLREEGVLRAFGTAQQVRQSMQYVPRRHAHWQMHPTVPHAVGARSLHALDVWANALETHSH